MPREKFKTLTEQMFYILLCLRRERRGSDILEAVRALTEGRVTIGSGTLYDLLEQFLGAGVILESGAGGGGHRRPSRPGAAAATSLRTRDGRCWTGNTGVSGARQRTMTVF